MEKCTVTSIVFQGITIVYHPKFLYFLFGPPCDAPFHGALSNNQASSSSRVGVPLFTVFTFPGINKWLKTNDRRDESLEITKGNNVKLRMISLVLPHSSHHVSKTFIYRWWNMSKFNFCKSIIIIFYFLYFAKANRLIYKKRYSISKQW